MYIVFTGTTRAWVCVCFLFLLPYVFKFFLFSFFLFVLSFGYFPASKHLLARCCSRGESVNTYASGAILIPSEHIDSRHNILHNRDLGDGKEGINVGAKFQVPPTLMKLSVKFKRRE